MPQITLEVLIELHSNMIQDFPVTAGFRNRTSSLNLEKLLAEILNSDLDCFGKAATICFELISKKPFNSLNKRMAIALISLYLDEEYFEYTASSLEALQLVNEIENGISYQIIEALIKEHSILKV